MPWNICASYLEIEAWALINKFHKPTKPCRLCVLMTHRLTSPLILPESPLLLLSFIFEMFNSLLRDFRLLLRGDMMKPGQKFFYQLTRCCECCCAQSMHTDCQTLALAMIRNCDETRTQAVEIIRNKQIYQLAE